MVRLVAILLLLAALLGGVFYTSPSVDVGAQEPDPTKIVTDEQLLDALVAQDIDKDYVELYKDFTAEHPYSQTYRDLKSNKQFLVVSGLPKVTPDGTKIEVGWEERAGIYTSKPNLFSAIVRDKQVEFTTLSGQVTWNPQLFLNNVEQTCDKAVLLGTDPDNENYHNNVLEWDYGICKRSIRIIEGVFSERWIFASDPKGEVRIKHNHSGDISLRLFGARDESTNPVLGAKVTEDEEVVSARILASAVYPVRIGASPLTANTTAADCDIRNTHADYPTCRNAAAGDQLDTGAGNLYIYAQNTLAGGIFYIQRHFWYWDTSSIGAGATVTATVMSMYSANKDLELDGNGYSDMRPYLGTQADIPGVGDYDSFAGGILTDDATNWELGMSIIAYEDVTFNAAGRAAIVVDGTTKVCTRISSDVDALVPTINNRVAIWCNEKGAGFMPKLVITYTEPPPPPPPTPPAPSVVIPGRVAPAVGIEHIAWFIPLFLFSLMAFWTGHGLFFMLAGGSSLMIGFRWFDLFATNIGLSMGLLLIAYSLVCLGFAVGCLFWKGKPVKDRG